MKNLFSFFLTALIMISLPACGGDEPDDPSAKFGPSTLSFTKLMTFTFNKSDNSVNYLGTAKYTLIDLQGDNNSQSVRMIEMADINFDPRMPFAVTFYVGTDFKTPNVTAKWTKTVEGDMLLGTINVAAPAMVNADGTPNTSSRYNISNLSGLVDEMNGVFCFAYDVSDQWRVVSVNNTLNSVSLYDDKAITAYRLVINQEKMTAELFLYNVQFEIDGVKSPVLSQISIPGLTVETAVNGLKVTGNGITPNYYMNGVPTPYPALTVTDFVMDVNILNAVFDLDFNCHGGNYKAQNVPLYLFSTL